MIQLARDAACTPIGAPCPAGTFPPPTGPATYVLPGALPPRTGTSTAPFATIDEALAADTTGTILLGKGVHAEFLAVGRSVELRGACTTETIVEGGAVSGGFVALIDLSVTAALDLQGAEARTEGVRLAAPISAGNGSILTGERVHFADTGTTALHIEGSSATVTNAIFTGVRHAAVAAGAMLVLEDVVVSRTSSVAIASATSTVAIRRSILERTTGHAVTAGDCAVIIEDTIVRDTAPSSTDDGTGVHVEGGTLEVARARIEHHASGAIRARHAGVSLADVVVRDVYHAVRFVRGVSLSAATVSIDRLALYETHGWALAMTLGSSGTARDVTIEQIGASSPTNDGKGVAIGGSVGPLVLERVSIADAFQDGIAVAQGPNDVTLRDISMARVGLTARIGKGIFFNDDPQRAVVERVLITDVREVGILAQDGADVSIADLDVSRAGAPALFLASATATVARMRARETAGGIVAYLESVVGATDVTLEDMRAGDTRFPGHGFESGGDDLVVSRFSVDGCAAAGVFSLGADRTRSSSGRVRGCVFGASVPDGFPIGALLVGTDLGGNGAPLEIRPP
jgi:hypothetical protein